MKWLDSIKEDAEVIFLMGDLFDFWFEYKHVVPKGFTRFLGKLAELSDNGIRLIIFTGNHDMWMYDYFCQELGAELYNGPKDYQINERKLHIGHGDGLGPGDHGYKFLKKIFQNKFCRFLFGRVMHANLGMFLGNKWAGHSWQKHDKTGDNYTYQGPEHELLFKYCEEIETKRHYDYYVFGHRHYKLQLNVGAAGAQYLNLGDWIVFDSYAVFDGHELKLMDYKGF